MIVEISGHEYDVVVADDVDGDVMDVEFRSDARELKPWVVVSQHGEPERNDLRVATSDDITLTDLRTLVRYGCEQHGAPSEVVRAPQPFTVSDSGDLERSPGLEFRNDEDDLLLTAWIARSSDSGVVWSRVWQEVELPTFDAMAAEAERILSD